MALFKWKGYRRPQVEMEPAERDPKTRQVIKPRKVIKFGPLPETTINGKRVRFDKDSGYLETDDPAVIKFLKQMTEYKRGIITEIKFRKEAVFVETPAEETEEAPQPLKAEAEKTEKKKRVRSVKDL